MKATEIAQSVIDIETEALAHIRRYFDERFERAIALFHGALRNGGKLVVTGVGKNLPIAEKISATLASTGSTSVVLNPSQAMHGDLGILAANDILLALSYSGESEEIKTLLPAVKRLGVTIVALTGNPDSVLAKLSECVIQQTVPREACPFNMAPTASTTAALAMGDAVAMALIDARGFKREDYAKLHPGGAIGRALLLRAGDVMRQGTHIATVAPDSTVKDVVLAMTKAKGGAAFIADAAGKLLGIYTDGDFRRGVSTEGYDLLGKKISEVMTANPICVKSTTLAVEVLNEFERRRIDDLPVVDDAGLLLGAIDIQDLPKMKVM